MVDNALSFCSEYFVSCPLVKIKCGKMFLIVFISLLSFSVESEKREQSFGWHGHNLIECWLIK